MSTVWERVPEGAKRITAVVGAITALVALLTTVFPWHPVRLTVALLIGGCSILAFGHMCDKLGERVDKKLDGMEKRMLERDKEQELSLKRLELITLMDAHPENKVEIERVARRYFIDLSGDWYATELYSKWATEHNGDIEFVIKHD